MLSQVLIAVHKFLYCAIQLEGLILFVAILLSFCGDTIGEIVSRGRKPM